MANRSSSAVSSDNPRRSLSVDTPPSPLSRDVQGSDNPIPLSPQWLLPKPVDNKQGILSGEPKANRSDAFKASGMSDDPHDSGKRKDVFRPSSFELDSGRRDRWRDEERETHSIRRDRWRDSDKELGHTYKTERWSDRHPNNNTNRDRNHEQQSESKWNKRWGPDDKESENRGDKWSDSARSYDGSRDRSTPHAKDTEKEGDGSRSWKSNSYLARGSQPVTPNKHPSTLSYGRGKGESGGSLFSTGRGKADNSTGILNNGGFRSNPTGFMSKRFDNAQGDTTLRYSRIKLLDVFRLTDIKSIKVSMEEFTDVPSLTVGEPLEPIALSGPTSEEMVIIKGIEKGDIVSSGLPQASKDGSNVNNSTDSDGLKQSRLGSRENLSVGDTESSDNLKVHKQLDESNDKEAGIMAKSPSHTTPWRSPSLAERTQGSYKRPDIVRSHFNKNPEMELQHNDRHLDQKNDPQIKRQSFEIMEQEKKSTMFHNSASNKSPEELNFYYKDPQGQIQGPFAGIDLIGWFENGYFGIDLQVRVADAPPDAPFSLLGDVMPHLRSKRPPPGFVPTTPNEAADLASRGVLGNAHPVLREVDAVKKMQRFMPGGEGEAEKRFIESLMSGNMNSPLSEHYSLAEGMKAVGSSALNPGNSPDINQLLAQRMSLERQRSIPTLHPFVRDTSLIGSKPEAVPETSPHSKFLPQSSPQVDFLSMLQAATADKPSSTATVNNNLAMWPNLNVVPTLNNSNQPIVSQTGFGGQLTNLHPQLLGQPDKLLVPEITQDPQFLNLLQQQYLMSQIQMQSQPPVPSQLSLLEKYLLLKQQQQQQQEQQLLIQQQQHMLSQVLSSQQPNQHFNEPSFGQINSSHLDALRNTMQVPTVSAISAHASSPIDVGIEAPRELNSGPAAYLPHQMFEDALQPINKNSSHNSDLDSTHAVVDNSILPTSGEKTDKKLFFAEKNVPTNVEVNAVQDASSAVVSECSKFSDVVSSSEVIGNVKSFDESIPKSAAVNEVKEVEVKETKKTSDKKSRKQKNAKVQPTSDKDSNKATSSPQIKPIVKDESNDATESLNSVHANVSLSSKTTTNTDETPSVNSQLTSSHRAWKPAPELRPKSLLEIQQEEQRRHQSQTIVSETPAVAAPAISSRTPWLGVTNFENQSLADGFQNPMTTQPSLGSSTNSATAVKNRKSPLHDLLAEEVLAKSKEESTVESNSSLPPPPQESAQADIPAVDDDFIEAKDTKKSRKKAAKAAKAAGVKASPPVASSYLSAPSVPKEKIKNTRQSQQDKEVLPTPPVGPSLGDFVPWKEDQTSPAAAAAWSTVDSSKLKKPASLRDILKEQEKKSSSNPSVPQQQIPVPNASTKSQSSRGNRGSGSSWSVAGSSPTNIASSPSQIKAASPGRASLASFQLKSKVEDDSVWDALDQSKQETKQSNFPSLSNPHSSGGKSLTKNASGVSSAHQKSNVGHSSSKEKKGTLSKQSEAMDFREWCETELVKLTGTDDTSFLEYCLRQSTSEAEMMLRENLGTMDSNHQFIDKFLDYKDFLSNDVIEMAFGVQAVQKTSGIKIASKETRASKDNETEGGGKKKGKKGKKVSPAVLGFNIVSNRIMMGEIQSVDD